MPTTQSPLNVILNAGRGRSRRYLPDQRRLLPTRQSTPKVNTQVDRDRTIPRRHLDRMPRVAADLRVCPRRKRARPRPLTPFSPNVVVRHERSPLKALYRSPRAIYIRGSTRRLTPTRPRHVHFGFACQCKGRPPCLPSSSPIRGHQERRQDPAETGHPRFTNSRSAATSRWALW